MGLMWFVEGMLVVLAGFAMWTLSRHYPIDWKAWVGMIVGSLLVLFALAWTAASFAEGEPQSGAMGILVFGVGGLIVFALTWRLAIQPAMNRASSRSGARS